MQADESKEQPRFHPNLPNKTTCCLALISNAKGCMKSPSWFNDVGCFPHFWIRLRYRKLAKPTHYLVSSGRKVFRAGTWRSKENLVHVKGLGTAQASKSRQAAHTTPSLSGDACSAVRTLELTRGAAFVQYENAKHQTLSLISRTQAASLSACQPANYTM